MKALTLLVEFRYDDDLMHEGDSDQEGKKWFIKLLKTSVLSVHESIEIGDEIGTMQVIKVSEEI